MLVSFGHPSKFQWFSRLGFVTAAMSLTTGQPNFARCFALSWAGTLYTFSWGWAAMTLGIGPHFSLFSNDVGSVDLQLN